MNSKRRAELQRKLSMGAVPRPPADLSDRIKGDIPKFLQPDADRERFTGSVAFSMRVAASILLLITTAFVTLRVLEPEAARQNTSMIARQKVLPAVARYQTPAANVAAERQAPAEEVRLDIAQEPVAVAAVPPISAEDRRVEAPRQVAANQNATGFAASPVPQPTETLAQSNEPPAAPATENDFPSDAIASGVLGGARAEAPVVADMPAPEPPAQVAEAESATSRKTTTRERTPSNARRAASAPSIAGVAQADELKLEQKREVFGISVDPHAFDAVKSALQKDLRPQASSVDVDALVNYFAGPPARAPRRGLALEVEASPAPVEAEGDQAILRFTIDTPRDAVGPRDSTPPAATDARIEIEIDSKAVATYRRIGTSAPVSPEATLLNNLSVTGLYQLDLRPGLKGQQLIATVRLRYRSIVDGKQHVVTRIVRGSDLARDWARASRRHRLASLGAVWSESLKDAGARHDVAKRAEELATQEPKDSRARELANAASATSGGKR